MYYRLTEEGQVVPCADMSEWSRWYETADRRVAGTDVGGFFVSTVFLGLDHRFAGQGPPVLWETMVRREDAKEGSPAFVDYQRRYASREDALAGHAAAVAWVEAGMPEQD